MDAQPVSVGGGAVGEGEGDVIELHGQVGGGGWGRGALEYQRPIPRGWTRLDKFRTCRKTAPRQGRSYTQGNRSELAA